MAGAHKRNAGLLAAWHLAGVVGHMPLTGRVLDAERINPFGGTASAAARERIDRVKAFIAGRGLAALGGANHG